MYVILLAIGAFVAISGVALIRYGVPLDEYGNSPLLVSGMVALVGGLIVIALSLVVRSLKRISERLDIQPLPLPPIADVGRTDPPPRPTAATIKPEPAPDVAAPEPRIEPRIEPSTPPPQAAAAPTRTVPGPSPAKPSLFGGLFGGKSKKPAAVSKNAAEPVEPDRVDLAPLTLVPERDPAPSPSPAGNSAVLPRSAPASGAAVYKSGVIDGMAYTLYVDGSIEAELPQGTIRFASVEALQTYLTSRSA